MRFLIGGVFATCLSAVGIGLWPVDDLVTPVTGADAAVPPTRTVDPRTTPAVDLREITLEALGNLRAETMAARASAEQAEVDAVLAEHQRIAASALSDAADDLFEPVARAAAATYRTDCSGQDAGACVSLADKYLAGEGVWSDRPLAISLYSVACDLGANAACRRARRLEEGWEEWEAVEGDGPEPTYEEVQARRDVKRAEVGGALQAALDESLEDFLPHYHGRVRRTTRGCLADQPGDCIALGHYYYREYASGSTWGVKYNAGDRVAGRALYLRACELGNADGCFQYAEAHNGIGEDSDPDVYLAYYEKACEMGLGWGCLWLGHNIGRDQNGPERDARKGAAYTRGCDAGLIIACHELLGKTEMVDVPLRVSYNLRACLSGDDQGCVFVSSDFRRGQNDVPERPEIGRALLEYGCEDEGEASCAILARLEAE